MAKNGKLKMTSPLYVSGKHVGQVHGPTGGKRPPDPTGANRSKGGK